MLNERSVFGMHGRSLKVLVGLIKNLWVPYRLVERYRISHLRIRHEKPILVQSIERSVFVALKSCFPQKLKHFVVFVPFQSRGSDIFHFFNFAFFFLVVLSFRKVLRSWNSACLLSLVVVFHGYLLHGVLFLFYLNLYLFKKDRLVRWLIFFNSL